jgi:hypothetical protein
MRAFTLVTTLLVTMALVTSAATLYVNLNSNAARGRFTRLASCPKQSCAGLPLNWPAPPPSHKLPPLTAPLERQQMPKIAT